MECPKDPHVVFMTQAIKLAIRGEGSTMPNPPVGSVIVSNGKIAGRGYHKRAGGPHAEIVALKSAGIKCKGATLYVTLEPCSTYGRTGPCTKAIIESGIRRVVLATRDPNPDHHGRGIGILKKAGIKVVEGVCRNEVLPLLQPFSKWIVSGKPFLTLKLAISLDGKIADKTGKSKWISSAQSRDAVMTLRRKTDAILIGSGTASKDDPSLLCSRRVNPFRVIVDSRGTLPLSAKVLNDGHAGRTIVATTKKCSERKCRAYKMKGARIWRLPVDSRGLVSLKSLMGKLGKMGVLSVLCEGGGEIAYSLVRERLVDKYIFFIAPILIGGQNSSPAVKGNGWLLSSCPRMKFTRHDDSGDDIMIEAVPE
ncbi:MAG: bifunctional diaminohydroxyphosphoribosylaminopyrimidine deaminase/5-amino-6-(5-phosphoribosylamino)uracil reductase RibD [Kiritimatiellae bacterium]|nr:bifunctional diaminohydroxyphosphoribosylaminopyrimidine deaminase/5-amino-6-(5-phosphoribosylamino)uracil reductase RibD [Kiritimatiellia bacterium]MDD5521268.1 bifunctional diaminohydroxyphosphoribosylaminopyrimidine deaminase/5-amino-6-(5-phosphoribosylamino)uracil reductase RibD [Kiritimatiellia bacterium]